MGCLHTTRREDHIFAETGVSLELNLFSLWCVDGPLPVGVAGDAESIFLELGDGEKVRNPALVDPHFKHSEVPF